MLHNSLNCYSKVTRHRFVQFLMFGNKCLLSTLPKGLRSAGNATTSDLPLN